MTGPTETIPNLLRLCCSLTPHPPKINARPVKHNLRDFQAVTEEVSGSQQEQKSSAGEYNRGKRSVRAVHGVNRIGFQWRATARISASR